MADPIYHFKFMNRKFKAGEVLPAFEGGKYDAKSDVIETEKDGKGDTKYFTRSDVEEYNPDIEQQSLVSFQVLMLLLMSESESD